MKKTVFRIFFTFVMSTLIFSCYNDIEENQLNNEDSTNENYIKSGVLESNSREIMRNGILELTDLMKVVSSDEDVVTEIYQSIKNDYYTEENVITLNDLIYFENSEAYKKANVSKNYQGVFKKELYEELKNNPKEYPNLNYIVNNLDRNGLQKKSGSFYDIAKITFYIPYLTNDNEDIIDPYNAITYVPAVIDADKGLGYKLNNNTGTYDKVMTDDDYANENITIIIEPTTPTNRPQAPDGLDGGGGGGGGGNYTPGNQYTGDCSLLGSNQGYIRQVFIGHARINNKHQYDAWVSFTGNGAGSEIRIGRLDSQGHIPISGNGNISADSWDNIVNIEFSRREIRRGTRKWVGSVWYNNWKCDGDINEVLFGVYEEDTEGDITFDATIKWKDTTLFNINANIHNRSKDQIIRKWTREKTEFFATNLLDQGGGTWAGEYSFSDRSWAIYDKGSDFCYTMPHRWVQY